MTTTPVPSFRRRLISLLYECLLLGAVLLVFFLLPQASLAVFAGLVASNGVLWVHLFTLLLLYFCVCWLRGGQTLAMQTWRIRVVDSQGGGLRPMQAVLRYCAGWLSVGLGGLGFLWCLIDRDGQFLHDRIADTRLVEIPSTSRKNDGQS